MISNLMVRYIIGISNRIQNRDTGYNYIKSDDIKSDILKALIYKSIPSRSIASNPIHSNPMSSKILLLNLTSSNRNE